MKYGNVTLGQIEAMINKLGGEDGVKRLLAGEGKIVFDRHLIDLDADPFVPEGWKVEEHRKGGQFVWSPEKVKLYLSPKQKGERYLEGNKLRKELEKERVMNANLLDYLFAHQELIPESWKKDSEGRTLYTFFWGTIYRDSVGSLYVRCLYFDEGGWDWSYSWLDRGWLVDDPAVVAS